MTAPPVFSTANPCGDLIPDDWYAQGGGIKSAPLPAEKTAGAWVSFGVAQTGQLDKANGQTRDAVAIVKKCEARDRALLESLQPKPWWHIW